MFSKTDIERQQAREEREAARAAKAITNPDGSPLQIFKRHVPEYQRRVRGRTATTPAYDAYDTIATLSAAKSWLTDFQESWRGVPNRENVQRVAEAIAHKLGTTAEEEITAAKKRAARRG
jgi:hypothetical protein